MITVFQKMIPGLLALLFSILVSAQPNPALKKGPLEVAPATVVSAQTWWNLLSYSIDLTPDYTSKSIAGTNNVTFVVLQSDSILQIDLQEPMRITTVLWQGRKLSFRRGKPNTYLIVFPELMRAGETETLSIQFEGRPTESVKPPYDNGWIWSKDSLGRPFISVACEGSGASIWLPCKDVLYDKPDNGVSFSITVPDTLTAVSNGRLKSKTSRKKGTSTYTWTVLNPINNYNIIPYIGKYVTWHKGYKGLKGNLDCDYWVVGYNLKKAKSHFKQVDSFMRAFEYWAGPYPFYEDSYKVVEAPMSGMEHQSAVAYGNGFENGLRGKDLISGSGWGLKFDFILVHETAHEWFGNSVTSSNHRDTWMHEGFAKYFETLYTSYVFGREAGNDYAIGTWKRIKNDQPVLGTTTSDQYYKGSAMLHMIRQIVGDSLFRVVLTGVSKEYYHQAITTRMILEVFNKITKRDFTKVFDQYLTTVNVPTLSYFFEGGMFHYRWENCVKGFAMPVSVSFTGSDYRFIYPLDEWQTLKMAAINSKSFKVDRNFYIVAKKDTKP